MKLKNILYLIILVVIALMIFQIVSNKNNHYQDQKEAAVLNEQLR